MQSVCKSTYGSVQFETEPWFRKLKRKSTFLQTAPGESRICCIIHVHVNPLSYRPLMFCTLKAEATGQLRVQENISPLIQKTDEVSWWCCLDESWSIIPNSKQSSCFGVEHTRCASHLFHQAPCFPFFPRKVAVGRKTSSANASFSISSWLDC